MDLRPRLIDLSADCDLGWIVGTILGDGYIRRSKRMNYTIRLHSPRLEYCNLFMRVVKRRFPVLAVTRCVRPPSQGECGPQFFFEVNSKVLYEFLRPHKQKDYHWTVPSEIKNSRDGLRGFLQGIFDAEGSVGETCIEISSKHRENLEQLLPLLGSFSVIGKIYPHGDRHWILHIAGKRRATAFFKEIGFRYSPKQEKLRSLITYKRTLYTGGQYEKALSLAAQGISFKSVAKVVGIKSDMTVWRWVKRGSRPLALYEWSRTWRPAGDQRANLTTGGRGGFETEGARDHNKEEGLI